MRRWRWTLLVFALAVGAGAYLSRKPWQELGRQRQAAAAAEDERRQAEAERARLVKEAAGLGTPTGREALARERGYRGPGEVPPEDLK